MKNIIRLTAIILILSTVCVTFTNCALAHGAKIIDDSAENFINSEFYAKNHVFGADYDNVYLDDSSYPRKRSFVIKTQEEYNAVFTENAGFEIDFDKKMLVVLTFATVYVRSIEMADVNYDDGALFVKIKSINPHPPWIAWGGSRSPYQRYVVIEINDCDVKNIDFEVKELAYSFDSFF